MSDADDGYRLEPNHFSKDEEHRGPRRDRDKREDPRHQNRRNERQGHEDRSRTGPSHGNNHYSTERPMQDMNLYSPDQEREQYREHRPRNEKVSREDRSRQQRHLENRSLDREDRGNHKEANQDRHRGYQNQPHKYLEDRPPHREGRSRDRVELSHSREEGSRDKYWEDGSRDKHRDKNPPRDRDQSWDVRAQSFPRDVKEVDSPLQSNYYKKDDLSLRYGPPPQTPTFDEREYYESEPEGGILECNKCRYLCTGRACCQMVEVLLNMLILVCASVSYNSTGGFTGITNMGGIYYYAFGGAYSGFQGADGEKAQKLDVEFYQLKLPTVSATMAFGGALMGFSCLMILIGVFRLPWHFPIWLIVECILDILIAFGYLPALYFYFRKLLDAYATQVCKDREDLYKSKGYEGFSCALHGADIAAGLFGCVAIGAFILSAVLAVQGFRRVHRLKKKQPAPTLEL